MRKDQLGIAVALTVAGFIANGSAAAQQESSETRSADAAGQAVALGEEVACRALLRLPNLTILSADIIEANGRTPRYCHVTGLISPGIHWHAQLPLPANWNGALLNIGNGGKAGNLVYDNEHLAQGYAVANSNTGHDNGSEPYSSFAFRK